MAVHDSRKRPRWAGLAARLAFVGAAALCVVGFLWLRVSESERLVDLLLEQRFTAGRLSGQPAGPECAVREDSAGFVPRTECGARLDPREREHVDRLLREVVRADSSPGDLRGLALVELRTSADVPDRLPKSVGLLQMAADAAPDDATLLNDLSVAYLALAEQAQRLDPMLRALENVERAYASEPRNTAVLYNRALIYQRLDLVHGAEQAWTHYLAVERNRRWRAEARRHLAEVRARPDTVSWDTLLARGTPPPLDATFRTLIQLRAAASPQLARESSFYLLAAWGRAFLCGDSVRAERWLAIAREIGGVLADKSVARMVAGIDSAADETDRLPALAQGHVDLADAFYLTETGKYLTAEKASETAEQLLRDSGSPAALWAAFYDASSEINDNRDGLAREHLEALIDSIPPDMPALVGKAIWAQGLMRLRRGDYGVAEKYYGEAELYIERAEETENRGAVRTLLSEALRNSGRLAASDSLTAHALHQLAPYRRSKYLFNQLDILAGSVRARGLFHAALALNTEAIKVAQTRTEANLPIPSNEATLYAQRALNYASLQNWKAADQDLVTADELSMKRGDSSSRARIYPDLARGQVMRLRDPVAAFGLLRNVVERYRANSGRDLYLPTALYEAALAARDAGELQLAREYLDSGTEHVEAQRASFEQTKQRAAFYETVENLFDLRIALEMDEGERDEAFAALERSRVSIWAEERGSAEPPALGRIGARLPEGTMLVEYALLPDRIVIWTVTRNEVRHHVRLVSRHEIAELAERFEQYTSTQELQARASASVRLHNLLIRPIAPQLRGVSQLTIVPDRELNGVPFAALWNPEARQFLVQSHTLRTAPSAAFYLGALERRVPMSNGVRALVVGNPTLHPELQAELLPLDSARSEARQVAGEYPGARPLTGDTARRNVVEERLERATVFHFAGHAVFDPDQPEQSYLALAPAGSGDRGRMHAWEIENLRLSNLQVVVLSACSTLGQRASHTGPAAGLAYSFLRAGAPATVSTLWDVPGSAPTRLLVDFHRDVAGHRDPAEALRRAQMGAIARGDTPRAWAAFVYTGP